MAVEVEPAENTLIGKDEMANMVRHNIKSQIGVSCVVRVKAHGEIPRSEGKAVRVRDNRK